MEYLLGILFEKIRKYFLLLLEAKSYETVSYHIVDLAWQFYLISAPVFNDNVLVEIEYNFFIHGIVLYYLSRVVIT